MTQTLLKYTLDVEIREYVCKAIYLASRPIYRVRSSVPAVTQICISFFQLYCPAFELVQRVQKYQKDYRKYESNIEESCRASASYYVALKQLYACIANNISNGARYNEISAVASISEDL